MMLRHFRNAAILLFISSVEASSFQRDVVRGSQQRAQQKEINDALLELAVPLDEYEAKLAKHGLTLNLQRNLEGNKDNNNNFYAYEEGQDVYSFSGYSIKYAQCQPVQYFSESAIRAGEHSPMITQDVVILRLCPYQNCNESTQYGCHYNFAEYALTLPDYLKVMIQFGAIKRDNICAWCAACMGYDNYNNNNKNRRLEDAQNAGNDNGNDDAGSDAGSNVNNCENFDTYCSDFDSYCSDPNQNGYMDYAGYLNYLDCAQVDYNDYAYFVRPRCTGGTIKMAIYYDNYCVQPADSLNVKRLGLGFRESFFTEFHKSVCIDCSDSEYPPYFNTGSIVCNKLHQQSAKCTSDLMYDLFDGHTDESSECSFIESIRFGTYDQYGNLAQYAGATRSWDSEVSTGQRIMLGISIGLCVFFIIYACYLHHAMTNLLIKSLSHRELLPPSRHNRRGRPSGRSVASTNGSRRGGGNDDEPDWHK